MISDVLQVDRKGCGELNAEIEQRVEGSLKACSAGPVLRAGIDAGIQQLLSARTLLLSNRIGRPQPINRLDAPCVARGLR